MLCEISEKRVHISGGVDFSRLLLEKPLNQMKLELNKDPKTFIINIDKTNDGAPTSGSSKHLVKQQKYFFVANSEQDAKLWISRLITRFTPAIDSHRCRFSKNSEPSPGLMKRQDIIECYYQCDILAGNQSPADRQTLDIRIRLGRHVYRLQALVTARSLCTVGIICHLHLRLFTYQCRLLLQNYSQSCFFTVDLCMI